MKRFLVAILALAIFLQPVALVAPALATDTRAITKGNLRFDVPAYTEDAEVDGEEFTFFGSGATYLQVMIEPGLDGPVTEDLAFDFDLSALGIPEGTICESQTEMATINGVPAMVCMMIVPGATDTIIIALRISDGDLYTLLLYDEVGFPEFVRTALDVFDTVRFVRVAA